MLLPTWHFYTRGEEEDDKGGSLAAIQYDQVLENIELYMHIGKVFLTWISKPNIKNKQSLTLHFEDPIHLAKEKAEASTDTGAIIQDGQWLLDLRSLMNPIGVTRYVTLEFTFLKMDLLAHPKVSFYQFFWPSETYGFLGPLMQKEVQDVTTPT